MNESPALKGRKIKGKAVHMLLRARFRQSSIVGNASCDVAHWKVLQHWSALSMVKLYSRKYPNLAPWTKSSRRKSELPELVLNLTLNSDSTVQ